MAGADTAETFKEAQGEGAWGVGGGAGGHEWVCGAVQWVPWACGCSVTMGGSILNETESRAVQWVPWACGCSVTMGGLF